MDSTAKRTRAPTPAEREWAAKTVTYEYDAREKARVHAARRVVAAYNKARGATVRHG